MIARAILEGGIRPKAYRAEYTVPPPQNLANIMRRVDPPPIKQERVKPYCNHKLAYM